MLIDCPGCGKSYHIIKAVLGPSGRRVACPRCDAIWFVAAGGSSGGEAAGACRRSVGCGGHRLRRRRNVALAELTEVVIPQAEVKKPPGAFPTAPAAAQRRSGPSWVVIGGAFLALSMALIGFRTQVVSLWPRTATAYAALGLPVNLRGLALEHFHTITTNDGFETVLGIEGEITNLRAHAVKKIPLDPPRHSGRAGPQPL